MEFDPKEYVLEALKPAKVKNLVFDTEKKSAQISVDEDQLSLAIGKKGQNARLTSRLTGWEINIGKDTATTVVEQKVAQAAQTLAGALPLTEEQALTLVKSGFTNLEGLRDADVQDLWIFSEWRKPKRAKFTMQCIGRSRHIKHGSV